MVDVSAFPQDYNVAKNKFQRCAGDLGWTLETYPIAEKGRNGETLTIDVAYTSGGDPRKVLVLSSGIHGVEGFFGSAVQIELLEQWVRDIAPEIKCVFIHGLNPYGFSWLRRSNENNVDLNRNFLLSSESYQGAPNKYSQLNSLLNPVHAPTHWELFLIKAFGAIVRYGMPTLRQAIASGQYEYPKGLFYGGAKPSFAHKLLNKHFGAWLQGAESVVHLDLHTGLGDKGVCSLLIDYALDDYQQLQLQRIFQNSVDLVVESNELAFQSRGGFGPWCVAQKFAPHYLFVTAEFGTTATLTVLKALRRENQAHHFGDHTSFATLQAKLTLKEVFSPSDKSWQLQVLKTGCNLVNQTVLRIAE